jgi:hypothetical protein
VSRYPLRWGPTLLSTAPVPILLGVAVALLLRPLALGVAGGLVVAVIITAVRAQRVRRRTLTITEDGLEVQRDSYALDIAWGNITGVRNRRLQGLLPVEELIVTDARIIERDSRGKPVAPPAKLAGSPALGRVQVSLYDTDWRHGPIGDRLRNLTD